jgi:hypothetical protein
MSLSDLLLSILGPAPESAISPPDRPLGESRLLINGRLVEARSGTTFDNVDPMPALRMPKKQFMPLDGRLIPASGTHLNFAGPV